MQAWGKELLWETSDTGALSAIDEALEASVARKLPARLYKE